MFLQPALPSFCQPRNVLKIQFRAVIENNFTGKSAEQLAAPVRIKKHLAAFVLLLLGFKDHFQALVVAGKAPGHIPVGGDVKTDLVEFVKFAVQEKSVFGSQAGIRRIVAHAESRLTAFNLTAAGCPEA